jgi:hypothetical protein
MAGAAILGKTLNFLGIQGCDFKPASTIAANEPAAKVLFPETHVLSNDR